MYLIEFIDEDGELRRFTVHDLSLCIRYLAKKARDVRQLTIQFVPMFSIREDKTLSANEKKEDFPWII